MRTIAGTSKRRRVSPSGSEQLLYEDVFARWLVPVRAIP